MTGSMLLRVSLFVLAWSSVQCMPLQLSYRANTSVSVDQIDVLSLRMGCYKFAGACR